MGTVYKAEHPTLKRLVALRLISLEAEDYTEDLRNRFYEAAPACAALIHPNIVATYDFSEEDGQPFLVCEYLDGEELGHLIARRERIPLAAKVGIMAQLCNALHYAHQQGVVHQDLKPGSILIQRNGQAKILDFGLATFAMSTRLARSGVLLGSPRYWAPEQVDPRVRQTSPRSDQYSLASVFYEFLAYRAPFDENDPIVLMEQIRHEQPPSLRGLAADVPADLVAIVERAMSKDPATRYPGVEMMEVDLERVLRGLGGGVDVPAGPGRGAPETQAPPQVPLNVQPRGDQPDRQSRDQRRQAKAAEEVRDKMERVRSVAEAFGVDQRAAQIWADAEKRSIAANTALVRGQFSAALEGFEASLELYRQADAHARKRSPAGGRKTALTGEFTTRDPAVRESSREPRGGSDAGAAEPATVARRYDSEPPTPMRIEERSDVAIRDETSPRRAGAAARVEPVCREEIAPEESPSAAAYARGEGRSAARGAALASKTSAAKKLTWALGMFAAAMVGGFLAYTRSGLSVDRVQVDASRARMLDARGNAEKLAAERYAASLFKAAQTLQREGTDAEARSDYDVALDRYADAEKDYAGAANEAGRVAATEKAKMESARTEAASEAFGETARAADAARAAADAAEKEMLAAKRLADPSTSKFREALQQEDRGYRLQQTHAYDEAAQAFRSAQALFATPVKDDLDTQLEQSQRNARTSRDQAVDAGAEKLATGMFEKAQAKIADGERLAGQRELKTAIVRYKEATEFYRQAKVQAVAEAKVGAELARERMLVTKERADRSLPKFREGEEQERQADALYKKSAYAGSAPLFRAADTSYSKARNKDQPAARPPETRMQDARKLADDNQRQAKGADAEHHAAERFEEATAARKQADRLAAAQDFEAATASYTKSAGLYAEAAEQSLAEGRAQADIARERMLARKELADESASSFADGRAEEGRANSLYEKSDYQGAMQAFASAERDYRAASGGTRAGH